MQRTDRSREETGAGCEEGLLHMYSITPLVCSNHYIPGAAVGATGDAGVAAEVSEVAGELSGEGKSDNSSSTSSSCITVVIPGLAARLASGRRLNSACACRTNHSAQSGLLT